MTNSNNNNSAAWNGTCPKCKNPNAYVGLLHWECPNERCVNYTAKQSAAVKAEMERLEKEKLALEQAENEENDMSDDIEDYIFGGSFGLGNWSG